MQCDDIRRFFVNAAHDPESGIISRGVAVGSFMHDIVSWREYYMRAPRVLM